ncbi:MAG: UDP-N-acetylmuramoyl-tripeptide--D-alanyl-D-alanine ligase [Sphingomonadales bacterium]
MSRQLPLWTFSEIAAVTGAVIEGDGTIWGLAIDSREATPGDLFVALKGGETDGHRFVGEAFANGAVAALVSNNTEIDEGMEEKLIRVPNTFEALETLAREARRRMSGKVIAVTGSAGKTGTRQAIFQALRNFGATHGSARSFNNHVGVPVSLARMPRDSEFAVFEIGMSAPGEIRRLAALVEPDVAVITSIGQAHLAGFEDIAGIADAKAEIFEGLKPGGVAVLNADGAYAEHLFEAAGKAGVKTIVRASLEETGADIHVLRMALHGDCSCLTVQVNDRLLTYKVGLPGRHLAMNSLLVLGAVQAVDGDLGLAGLALAGLLPLPGRGMRWEVEMDRGSFLLIDESYNANPLSMEASLEVLGMAEPEGKGRRLALLGDMEELGEASLELHLALSNSLKEADVAAFFPLGPGMTQLAREIGGGLHAPVTGDRDELLREVKKFLRSGDVLLIKGSNRQRLAELVEDLRDWGRRQHSSGFDHPPMAAE